MNAITTMRLGYSSRLSRVGQRVEATRDPVIELVRRWVKEVFEGKSLEEEGVFAMSKPMALHSKMQRNGFTRTRLVTASESPNQVYLLWDYCGHTYVLDPLGQGELKLVDPIQ